MQNSKRKDDPDIIHARALGVRLDAPIKVPTVKANEPAPAPVRPESHDVVTLDRKHFFAICDVLAMLKKEVHGIGYKNGWLPKPDLL